MIRAGIDDTKAVDHIHPKLREQEAGRGEVGTRSTWAQSLV